MPTYVALLRGINVGGKNKIAMAELRTVVAELGHTGVSTYINSGNVLFTAPPDTDIAAMSRAMSAAIAARLGVSTPVVIVPRDELAEILSANPFSSEPNPRRVHAVFLSEPAGPDLLSKIDTLVAAATAKGARDSVRAVGRALYLHTPDGFGNSDVSEGLMRVVGPKAAVVGTARNWATASKLLTLCDAAAVPNTPAQLTVTHRRQVFARSWWMRRRAVGTLIPERNSIRWRCLCATDS